LPTFALLDEPIPRTIAEFHWRFSKIFMLLVLMIFALCFSSITYRKARFPGMVTALLVYFAYSNSLGVAVALIRKESVPPHISLWVVNLTFFALAIYMFRRRSRNQRLIPGLAG
jgi:lipopolysaccharide export system permease protein